MSTAPVLQAKTRHQSSSTFWPTDTRAQYCCTM